MPVGQTINPSEGASGAWADLAAGIYAADIKDVTVDAPSSMFPDSGPRFKWVFSLPDEADGETGEAVELHYWTSQKLTDGAKRSKFWTLALAAGLEPTQGVPFDPDGLIGKSVQLMVNVVDGQRGPRPVIVEVIPPKVGGAVKAPAASPKAPAPVAGGAEIPKDEQCDVPNCGNEMARYDDNGTALCKKHGG
jgi:hypothetical protein